MATQPRDDGPRIQGTDYDVQLVGRRIEYLRHNFHLTHPGEPAMSQDKLAREVGISRAALANFVSGRRPFPIRTIQDIAVVLGVAPELISPQARRTFADPALLGAAA